VGSNGEGGQVVERTSVGSYEPRRHEPRPSSVPLHHAQPYGSRARAADFWNRVRVFV